MITIPMYYIMPQHGLRTGLQPMFPYGTNTSILCEMELRSGTTRRKFLNPGAQFKIQNCSGTFEVIKVQKIDLQSDQGINLWETFEGWNAQYAMENFPRQVYHGATQTIFRRVEGMLSQRAPINDNDWVPFDDLMQPDPTLIAA